MAKSMFIKLFAMILIAFLVNLVDTRDASKDKKICKSMMRKYVVSWDSSDRRDGHKIMDTACDKFQYLRESMIDEGFNRSKYLISWCFITSATYLGSKDSSVCVYADATDYNKRINGQAWNRLCFNHINGQWVSPGINTTGWSYNRLVEFCKSSKW